MNLRRSRTRLVSTRSLALLFGVALLGAAPPCRGAMPPELRQTVDALVAVLVAGDAAAYERFTQERCTPEMLARRTPEQRRQFLARFHGDFGAFDVTSELVDAWTADLELRAQRGGLTGKLHLALEAAPPHRIQDLSIAVEAGGAGEPPKTALPPLPEIKGIADPRRLGALLGPYLQKLADAGALSGVVLVAHEGKPVYQQAYGMADRERRIPNHLDTRLNLASIGKQFTHVAIGQLLAAGKLALDDAVVKHLPGYPNADAARQMTIRQLIEHKAGVPDIFRVVKEGDPPPRSNHEWFSRVAPQPLDFEPGTQTRYCNGCYVVLGEVVAAVSGLAYEEYLARHVFAPAGMTATAFLAGGDPGPKQAVGYTARQGQGLEPASLGPGGRGCGAGGVFSTAGDLLAYDNALRGERLLDHQRTNWLLGVDGDTGPRRAVLGVAGGAPGTNTVLESDGTWTVIVLTNRDPRLGEDLGVALARALRG